MTEDMRTPILPGKGASDYERYLRTDELLALQKPPEEMLHPDELTFQVTHQASELLMKGAAWELDRARQCIIEGDFKNAARLLRRANKMLVHPLRMLSILETITPYEYHVIRAGLDTAAAWILRGSSRSCTSRRGWAKPFLTKSARPALALKIYTVVIKNSSNCMRLPKSCSTTMSRFSSFVMPI